MKSLVVGPAVLNSVQASYFLAFAREEFLSSPRLPRPGSLEQARLGKSSQESHVHLVMPDSMTQLSHVRLYDATQA
jgi:hypothetical protein